MVCSSFAGTSSGGMGDFAVGEKTASISSSARFERLLADHRGGFALGGLRLRGLLAQLELQAPAVVADFRFAPGFERADFGEARAQLDRDQALLGLLAEADDGVERRVHVQVGIGGIEFEHLAELVVGAGERAVEAEGDGAVGDELQRVVIDLDGGAFLGAARHQADGGELALARLAEADVIGAGQTAAHQHAAPVERT